MPWRRDRVERGALSSLSARTALGAPSQTQPRRGCIHPRGNPGANLKSISHRRYFFEVAFVWELTKETIHLPLGCLQGRVGESKGLSVARDAVSDFTARQNSAISLCGHFSVRDAVFARHAVSTP